MENKENIKENTNEIINENIREDSEEKNEKLKWNVANALSVVYEKLHNSKLRFKKTQKFNEAMTRLMEYMGTTEIQTWIMSIILALYFESPEVTWDISDLRRDVDCDALKTATWRSEIEHLKKMHYLKSSRSSTFYPTDTICLAVSNNEKIVIDPNEFNVDFSKFVSYVADQVENRISDNVSVHRFFHRMRNYEAENENLEIVKKMRMLCNDIHDRVFFYDCCSDYLHGADTNLSATINDLYEGHERFIHAEDFINEKNILIEKGLIEFTTKGNMRDTEFTLTEKGVEIMAGEQSQLFVKKIDEKLLIQPEKIKEKKLFYSKENQEQIDILKNALEPEKMKAIQERLKNEALPIGVAVLLYGAPGTGKTESVFQIAKATGRPIVHVDISDTKSCWFGESEKKIKELFKNYQKMCDAASKLSDGMTPILLFNEADAVFSRRKTNAVTSVDQTENAMQNIILEEMENLKGIMIATTNLADNLDPAFERRFLFKIKFENPSVECKRLIWQNKLSWLSEKDAQAFAERYEFSGGQIDNIVRKVTMNEVLTGNRPSIKEIDDMWRVEKLCKDSSKRIGFSDY